jgi:hypothetical protein
MEDQERLNEQQVPESEESLVSDAEQEAATEAGEIGGKGGAEEVTDPAERPIAEGGGGESEGFELAEHDLEENATNLESPNPRNEAFTPEEERSDAEYGEADEEKSSQDVPE